MASKIYLMLPLSFFIDVNYAKTLKYKVLPYEGNEIMFAKVNSFSAMGSFSNILNARIEFSPVEYMTEDMKTLKNRLEKERNASNN